MGSAQLLNRSTAQARGVPDFAQLLNLARDLARALRGCSWTLRKLMKAGSMGYSVAQLDLEDVQPPVGPVEID